MKFYQINCLNAMKRAGAALLTAALLTMCACGGATIAPGAAPAGVDAVLVLPFQDMSKVYDADAHVRCPLCGQVFQIGEVAEYGPDVLTDHLSRLLDARADLQTAPPAQARGIRSELLDAHGTEILDRFLFVEIGRRTGADAVMAGYVYRFRERVGASYGVDAPASVAFDLHLIRSADAAIIWSGHFDETQQPLTDDLFKLESFLQRKGRWVSATEMAEAGLEKMLQRVSLP